MPGKRAQQAVLLAQLLGRTLLQKTAAAAAA